MSEQKPSQAMSNDDIDDILELVDVVKVGKGVPEAPSGDAEADFTADLDSMLDDLETEETKDMPFPDPTPVDYEVDPNESLDLPSMDDLDNLLAELGAEKNADPVAPADVAAAGDSLDSADRVIGDDDNKASITAALDQALSNLDELDGLDESLTASLTPKEDSLDTDEFDDIFAKAVAAESDPSPKPVTETSSTAEKSMAQADFEAAEMVHPDDIFLDVANQLTAEQDNVAHDKVLDKTPQSNDSLDEFEAAMAKATESIESAAMSPQPQVLQQPDYSDPAQSDHTAQSDQPGLSNQSAQPDQPDDKADLAMENLLAAPVAVPSEKRESLPIDIEGLEEVPVETALGTTLEPTTAPQDAEIAVNNTGQEMELMADVTLEVTPEATPEAAEKTPLAEREPDAPTLADASAESTGAAEEPSAKAAVSGTRIDADLNELDALLDHMLSSSPPSATKIAEEHSTNGQTLNASTLNASTLNAQALTSSTSHASVETSGVDATTLEPATWDTSPLADELHDILERLDNLESAPVTEQLLGRCSALEAQLAQKEAAISNLEESLALRENQLTSLEEAFTGQQNQITSLKALLNEQKEHMAALDTHMEKMVAAAAAKVIREEITALIQSMQDDE